jgi:hypothetical protein
MQAVADQQRIEGIIARLKAASWRDRDAIREELLAAARAAHERSAVLDILANARKDMSLELRWEIDEILAALAPPPAPVPPKEEEEEEAAAGEPEDPKRIRMGDLKIVYDDPRGLQVYKTRKGDRWFAMQADPSTGRPQTFELHPQEVEQLKRQLQGSPYWVIGS